MGSLPGAPEAGVKEKLMVCVIHSWRAESRSAVVLGMASSVSSGLGPLVRPHRDLPALGAQETTLVLLLLSPNQDSLPAKHELQNSSLGPHVGLEKAGWSRSISAPLSSFEPGWRVLRSLRFLGNSDHSAVPSATWMGTEQVGTQEGVRAVPVFREPWPSGPLERLSFYLAIRSWKV